MMVNGGVPLNVCIHIYLRMCRIKGGVCVDGSIRVTLMFHTHEFNDSEKNKSQTNLFLQLHIKHY